MDADAVAEAIASHVGGIGSAEAGHVAAFYEARDHQPAWMDALGSRAAEALLTEAMAAHEHGLCPYRYDAARLLDRFSSPHADAGAAAAFDVSVTQALVRLALHVAHGATAADNASPVRDVEVSDWLADARANARTATLDALAPEHPEYAALREAHARYQQIAREGGWPTLPDDLLLRPGDTLTSEVYERLDRRLRLTGDLEENGVEAPSPDGDADAMAPTYDDVLVAAVRRAQRRHGLAADGILGPQTAGALNVPVETRLSQLAVNMDRWRQLPDDLGRRHVRVNIPDFTLAVVENDSERLTMRAIVGLPDRQTPAFSDRIRYLEFRPYWNVPDSIMRRDILPEVQENPEYLHEHRYEVLEDWHGTEAEFDAETFDWETDSFDYRLRQMPGPHNSLGLVKFMFPNRHAVYLHDTPSPELFDRRVRAFSSGCVRVEDPVALARVLLADGDENDDTWTAERIREEMDADDLESKVVYLPEAVPVHLMYMTAWVGEDGQVEFRPDVYDHDARAAERLACPGGSLM